MELNLKRHAAFGVFIVALVAALGEELGDLVALSENDATASHIPLIPLLVLALVVQRRRHIFVSVTTNLTAGLLALAAGACLAALGSRQNSSMIPHDSLSLTIAGFVVMSAGAFLLVYGVAAFRAALFPWLLLVFMVPIPTSLLSVAIYGLKSGSAQVVAALFAVTSTPHHREAFVFSLPTFAIEIADECSGIRSSIALILTTLLVADQSLKTTPWKLALVLMALPFAILKNGIRIAMLALLSLHVDPSFLTSQLHREGGIVFFLLTVTLMTPLFLALQRAERCGQTSSSPASHVSIHGQAT